MKQQQKKSEKNNGPLNDALNWFECLLFDGMCCAQNKVQRAMVEKKGTENSESHKTNSPRRGIPSPAPHTSNSSKRGVLLQTPSRAATFEPPTRTESVVPELPGAKLQG
eukprot:CAMPEP_0181326046 /NCGR_PEP_ID=MMETSP1101-20121128/21271_1 /TAXON_ID=46948 /ORGANISM="Rhodomonas abbreviata, Strain Caron Lab Isolate" /LENGTH=108 /DNA_ID=CAMNT_0023434437 /DNA_START=90 /DNA_END=416 /DNA_ORIENTATION=+